MDFWWCHIVIYLLWMVQILLMFVFQDSRYPTCRLPSQTWGRPIRPWPPGLCYPIKIWRRSRCCLPLILRCGMCMKFTWNINVKHPLTQDAWMKGSGGWWRGGLVLEWVHAYQFTLIGNYMQFCWKGLVILLWKARLQWWPKPAIWMSIRIWNQMPLQETCVLCMGQCRTMDSYRPNHDLCAEQLGRKLDTNYRWCCSNQLKGWSSS